MREYIVTQTTHGFTIRNYPPQGAIVNELYAFSTLKELTDYLPKLLEPQIPLDLNLPGVGE